MWLRLAAGHWEHYETLLVPSLSQFMAVMLIWCENKMAAIQMVKVAIFLLVLNALCLVLTPNWRFSINSVGSL